MTGIDAVFRPKRVAVLGASTDPTKFGHSLVRNLQNFKFPGDVYPISRSAPEICGYKAFGSLKDLPQAVDLVLISIPSTAVPAGIADAVAANAKAAVVFTAGFQEVGEEGRKLQQEMVQRADGRLRMIGPNCLGVRNFHLPLNASPMRDLAAEPGPIAFVSQSGAFGNAAIAALRNARIGLSKLASIGNMADITHAHMFRYLADDPETSVITAFVEGVPDVKVFLDTVNEVSRTETDRDPQGRTLQGRPARRAVAHRLARRRRPGLGIAAARGRRGVRRQQRGTVRHGAGVRPLRRQAAARTPRRDLRTGRRAERGGRRPLRAARHGGAAARRQLQELRPLVPPFASLGNPVEVTGQTKREHLDTCAQAIVRQPNVDAMVGIAIGLDFPEFARALAAAREVKPVTTCLVAPNSEAILAELNVPNYPSVDRAVRALHHLMDRGATLAQPPAGAAGWSSRGRCARACIRRPSRRPISRATACR